MFQFVSYPNIFKERLKMTSAGKSRKQTENKTIYLSLIVFLLNAIIGKYVHL